jgi:hypothetical protein
MLAKLVMQIMQLRLAYRTISMPTDAGEQLAEGRRQRAVGSWQRTKGSSETSVTIQSEESPVQIPVSKD